MAVFPGRVEKPPAFWRLYIAPLLYQKISFFIEITLGWVSVWTTKKTLSKILPDWIAKRIK